MIVVHNATWSRFIRKKFVINSIINVVTNTTVPYLAIRGRSTMTMFGGEEPLAQFLLPLSFFIPFFVSLDLGIEMHKLFDERISRLPFPKNIRPTGLVVKNALLCAGISLATVALLTGVFALLLPRVYIINPTWFCIALGLLSFGLVILTIMRSLCLFRRKGILKVLPKQEGETKKLKDR